MSTENNVINWIDHMHSKRNKLRVSGSCVTLVGFSIVEETLSDVTQQRMGTIILLVCKEVFLYPPCMLSGGLGRVDPIPTQSARESAHRLVCLAA